MGLRGLGDITVNRPRQLSGRICGRVKSRNVRSYFDLILKAGSILVLYRPYKNPVLSLIDDEPGSSMNCGYVSTYPSINSKFSSCVRRHRT